jgi:uncharacterized protein YegP (UPF0339 family)
LAITAPIAVRVDSSASGHRCPSVSRVVRAVACRKKDRFVINRSKDGQFYFILRADNGQVLVTSETYTTKESAQNGIRAVKEVASSAPIVGPDGRRGALAIGPSVRVGHDDVPNSVHN